MDNDSRDEESGGDSLNMRVAKKQGLRGSRQGRPSGNIDVEFSETCALDRDKDNQMWD
jgi:hypothetical protein